MVASKRLLLVVHYGYLHTLVNPLFSTNTSGNQFVQMDFGNFNLLIQLYLQNVEVQRCHQAFHDVADH